MEIICIIGFIFIYWKITTVQKMLLNIDTRLKELNSTQNSFVKESTEIKTEPLELSEIMEEIDQNVIKEEVLTEEDKELFIEENPQQIKIKKPSFSSKIKEKYTSEAIEQMLFGNIILKIGVIAFILGIGLFLKYSIDKNWIPVWGRAMIGIGVGISMLLGGVKLIKNDNKLFSEGLFGGGIAILYLSIFAGFALKGFAFLPFAYAFVAMLVITFLAGVISIRFDAKSTAVFGLIGGFLTPFLISTGSENVVGLLEYMLMLNFGVLYISIYKKWSILSWMAFVITALTQLGTSIHDNYQFIPMIILFGVFFVIYSIVPFINEIREKQNRLNLSFVILFVANFFIALGSFYLLFDHHGVDEKYFTIITIGLATYLLIYAGILGQKNLFLKNLFYIVLAQAVALLLFTPALIFTGVSLTIVWAVESLMLLWIANRSQENTYAIFSFIGFIITLFRYMLFDLSKNIFLPSRYYLIEYSEQLQTLTQNFAITTFFVLGSLFLAYKIVLKSTLEVDFRNFGNEFLAFIMFMTSFILIFISISTIIYNIVEYDYFIIYFMGLIGLFSVWLSQSEYALKGKLLFNLLLILLVIHFIVIIESISPHTIIFSLIQFIIFSAVFIILYTFGFKSNRRIRSYKISNIILVLGVGLLFVFLNVALSNTLILIKPEATKLGITLLWVIFGIGLFVFGIMKEIKFSKVVGTFLIFLAILKAFLFDLADLDYIFKILLFIVLGILLFGLSYFYQSKNNKEKE